MSLVTEMAKVKIQNIGSGPEPEYSEGTLAKTGEVGLLSLPSSGHYVFSGAEKGGLRLLSFQWLG